jgi:hypothetical protein
MKTRCKEAIDSTKHVEVCGCFLKAGTEPAL